MRANLINFLCFQVGWFACVLGAAGGLPLLGPAVVIPLLVLHLAGFERRGREALFLVVVVVLGTVVDSLEERAGLLDHGPDGRLFAALCPVWIVALWALFASTFHRSLGWLVGRPWLAALLGAVGGPLSYRAGAALGAVAVPDPSWSTWITLGVVWGLTLPVVAELALRIDPRPADAPVAPRRWLGAGAPVGLALVLCLLAATGCGISKQELRDELLAIPKNAPFASADLRTLEVPVDFGDGEVVLQCSYLHAGEALAEQRDPGRVPLLLLHGTPSSLFTWVHVIEGGTGSDGEPFAGLKDEFEIFAPDLPGHGTTGPGCPPYTFERLVAFTASFLEALDLERVVVAGHSYGGEVAWRFALRHPERVEQLVLMDASGYHRTDVETPEEEVILKRHPLARYGRIATSVEDVRETLEISFVNGVPDDEVLENYWLVQNGDNWRAMVELARDEEGYAEAEIAAVEVPTLLVWGEEDNNFPVDRHGERFAADIARSRLVRIAGSGHYPQVERPEEVVRHIRDFSRQR